jgi:hypothetical protein
MSQSSGRHSSKAHQCPQSGCLLDVRSDADWLSLQTNRTTVACDTRTSRPDRGSLYCPTAFLSTAVRALKAHTVSSGRSRNATHKELPGARAKYSMEQSRYPSGLTHRRAAVPPKWGAFPACVSDQDRAWPATNRTSGRQTRLMPRRSSDVVQAPRAEPRGKGGRVFNASTSHSVIQQVVVCQRSGGDAVRKVPLSHSSLNRFANRTV